MISKFKTEIDSTFLLFGFTFFSGSMLVGRIVAESLSLYEALLCFLLGGFILGSISGVLAYISSSLNKDLVELVSLFFGKYGKNFILFLIALTQIGWFGIGASMFSIPFSDEFFHGSSFSYILLTYAFGILMLISAAGGINFLTKLSYIAVPVILILGLCGTIKAVNNIDLFQFVLKKGELSISNGVSLVVGSYIAGSLLTPNFTYLSKRPLTVSICAFSAFCIGNGLMLIFGAVSYYLIGGSDIFDLFRYFDLLLFGFICLGLNIWSSCDNGLYSASLCIHSLTRINRKKIVIFVGVISIIFSPILYKYFLNILVFLNSLLPPIGIMFIFNYLFFKNSLTIELKINLFILFVVEIVSCLSIGEKNFIGFFFCSAIYAIIFVYHKYVKHLVQ